MNYHYAIIEQIKSYIRETYDSKLEAFNDLDNIVRRVYNHSQVESITEAHRLIATALHSMSDYEFWSYYDEEDEDCCNTYKKARLTQFTPCNPTPQKSYEEKTGTKRKLIILNEEE